MDVKFNGTIQPGMNAAYSSLTKQWRHFDNVLPKGAKFHVGTINVLLDHGIRVRSARDCAMSVCDVHWHPSHPDFSEDFGFFRGAISRDEHPEDAADCLIYFPMKSGHRFDPRLVEIIAPFLSWAKTGERCSVLIRDLNHVERTLFDVSK